MHNIKILLFCWILPSIPPPPGADHVTLCGSAALFWKMASVNPRLITFEETKLLSFFRQNIIHKLCEEAERQGLSERDPRVIQVVVAYFNRGPMPHHVFHRLMWHLAHTI